MDRVVLKEEVLDSEANQNTAIRESVVDRMVVGAIPPIIFGCFYFAYRVRFILSARDNTPAKDTYFAWIFVLIELGIASTSPDERHHVAETDTISSGCITADIHAGRHWQT